jgi:hypothetical protein
MPVHVTKHALQRYIERVEAVSLKTARARIEACERAILAAVAIGCKRVVMPCRATLILGDGATVVTVNPVEAKRSAATGKAGRSKRQKIQNNGKGRQKWNAEREQEKW